MAGRKEPLKTLVESPWMKLATALVLLSFCMFLVVVLPPAAENLEKAVSLAKDLGGFLLVGVGVKELYNGARSDLAQDERPSLGRLKGWQIAGPSILTLAGLLLLFV